MEWATQQPSLGESLFSLPPSTISPSHITPFSGRRENIVKTNKKAEGSDGFQEVFAPHPAAALRSSDQHLALALPGEQQLTTFQQDTATPSLQTKVR
ncbi:hypothetical protein E2C01_099238 [Portunus trituberculatus]|uniref:Uncharacterized protein n=1 Tax=Portunus trituberculatus TaxID=210409 RepID=A0A5B7KAG3_PORTR|nr:hypothetical protein [Portunus trituberculatus]